MNFKKLQAMQAKLDEAILKEKAPMTAEERFNKTLVALSVEIAEVANTVEHFKFWKDNKGKVDAKRFYRIEYSNGDCFYRDRYKKADKEPIVTSEQAHHVTLVEEASDCLHFLLSLANQLDEDISTMEYRLNDGMFTKEERYRDLQKLINYYDFLDEIENKKEWVRFVVEGFHCYTYSLGVTREELEQAYYKKNKINYERLENGY